MVVELKGDQLEISNSTAGTTRSPVTEFFQADYFCYFSHRGRLHTDGSIRWSNGSVWSRLSGDNRLRQWPCHAELDGVIAANVCYSTRL